MTARFPILAAALLFASSSALAEGLARIPYTGVEASYATIDIEDLEEDASGISLDGFLDVGGNVFVTAGYATAKTRDFTLMGFRGSIEVTDITLGIGYHHALNPEVDLVGQAAMVRAETDPQGDFNFIEDERDTGWSAELGLRALVTPQVELTGGFGYVNIYDDSSTGVSLQGFFYPAAWLGLGVGYEVADDSRTLQLTGRVVF